MSQSALIVFLVSFVGGPLLCAAILRLPRTVTTLLILAAGVVISMSVALWMQSRDPLGSLTLMWIGWVLAVGLTAHAFRRRAALRWHPWITVIALVMTPLPWFGLATARLLTPLTG